MKKSILIVLTSILLSYPISLMGADYETPHEFSAGDTISAEMMNELFNYIKLSKEKITSETLVGKWDCLVFYGKNKTGLTGSSNDADSLTTWRDDIVYFTDDNDGTYSFSTDKYDLFIEDTNSNGSADNQAVNGLYVVKNNVLVLFYRNYNHTFTLTKNSNTSINLDRTGSSTFF